MNKPERTYVKGLLIVEWWPERCVKCHNCTDTLPQVFDPSKRPWVDLEKATDQEIIDTVKACPDQALCLKDISDAT